MRKTSLLSASLVLLGIMVIGGCSSSVTLDEEREKLVYPKAPAQPRFYFERTIMSSLDVEYETEDSKIQRFLTGVGSSASGMTKPFDIAVHKGRIFVSDPAGRTVHMFDPHNYSYKKVGDGDDDEVVIQKPYGIDVDAAGNLYIMDQTAGNIKVYTRDGDFIRQIGEKKMFSMPTGLAVTQDGSKLYISDTGGVSSNKHHILEFDAVTGDILNTIGKRGSEDLEFNLPKDILIDQNNHLYVVDSGNFRVQVINLNDGSFVRTFGQIGRRPGQFSRPKGIAIDKDGNVYVSDAAFGNFQIFNNQGQLLLAVGERSGRLQAGKFMLNAGIAVDEDGRILMADQYHRKIDVFRPVALAEEEGYLGIIKNMDDKQYEALKAELENAEKVAESKNQ